jgi:hypothetical protein
MLSTKIRTAIIASTTLAALSIPGAASAAVLVRSPITQTPVVQSTTTTAKEAGSAGVKGYDNGRCERLLSTYNSLHQAALQAAGVGLTEDAVVKAEAAGSALTELENNCLVVD